jgi:diguanylate cyclase (GGDEF)-like protein
VYRLFVSWRALAAAFVLAVAGLSLLAYNLDRQQREEALRNVVAQAHVVNELLLHVDYRAGTGDLDPGDLARVDGSVQHLVGEGNLIGLQLWDRQGRLLYSDAAHPAPLTAAERAQLDEVLAGRPHVQLEQDNGRSAPSATVLLHMHDHDDRSEGVVAEILLPERDMTGELSAATWRLYAGAGALLVVASLLAAWGRRRILHREHEALHDPLTGLGNRALLVQAGAELSGDRRTRVGAARSVTALLLLDLDGFKEVNDTLGHAVGDQLLVQVAEALRGAVRSADVVTRLGGDEFAVLLRGLPDADAAVRAATEIAAVLQRRPFDLESTTLEVGVSLGVALHLTHADDLPGLLRRADVAMYQAKRAGGGVRLYDQADDPHDESQLDLLSQLRAAIDEDQLRLHFQPRVGLRTGRTVGFEALVRWAHPDRGLLPPGTFVPLAERTALMHPLTDWVLRSAIRECARWRSAGRDVGVAVNIPPATLLDAELPARMTELLARERLPGHALELEITETAVMVDPERTAETLRRLRAVGVRVAIDDFGAGYTSLSYLKTLPVSSLKIDRGFVTHLLDDDRDEAVTRSIVQLGHDLGLVVVAEGVETAGVQERLRELGCDEAQGFLLAAPMEAADVLPWLAAAPAALTPA